jgi:hypothetical protein
VTASPAGTARATRGMGSEGNSVAALCPSANSSVGAPSTNRVSSSTNAAASTGRPGSPSSSSAQARSLRAPREGRDHASRETREHTQVAYLRQEVAQQRRRINDLSAQVRTKEGQVENLTGMLKEMQVTHQRQRL